jgi:hypothetical protein
MGLPIGILRLDDTIDNLQRLRFELVIEHQEDMRMGQSLLLKFDNMHMSDHFSEDLGVSEIFQVSTMPSTYSCHQVRSILRSLI